MLRVTAGKAEFCLQRDVVRETSLKTLFNRITRRLDEIVDKLKLVVVPRILDWEYFLKNLIQTFILSVLRGCVKLEEVLERLQLHFKKVWICQDFRCGEIYSFIDSLI